MSLSPTAEAATSGPARPETSRIALREIPRESAECFPAIVALTLIVVCSEHDGGFDQDTWGRRCGGWTRVTRSARTPP